LALLAVGRLLPSDDDDGDGDDDRKEMMAQWQPPAPLLQYIWILCLFFCPNQLPDEDKGISFVFSFRFSPFLFFVFLSDPSPIIGNACQ